MNTGKLCDLLEQKLDVFKGFLSATMSLKELSESDSDMENIVLFIDKRQNCINTIDKIDREVNGIIKKRPPLISSLPGKDRESIKAFINAINDTASKAAHVNREIEMMLRLSHVDIKNRLKKAGHTRNGVKGYASKNYEKHVPRFLDVRL